MIPAPFAVGSGSESCVRLCEQHTLAVHAFLVQNKFEMSKHACVWACMHARTCAFALCAPVCACVRLGRDPGMHRRRIAKRACHLHFCARAGSGPSPRVHSCDLICYLLVISPWPPCYLIFIALNIFIFIALNIASQLSYLHCS